jgi:signal transduction histidine kinase
VNTNTTSELPSDDPRHNLLRPHRTAAVIFVLALAVSFTVIWRSELSRQQIERARASDIAGDYTHSIQTNIERALSATYSLAAMVRQGKGSVQDFEATAGEMLPYYPGVGSLQLAPGGVVLSIVPLAGNQGAIGHDLLKDPTRNKEAFMARDTGKLTLAGPFNLKQGGVGAVGRLPVYLDDQTDHGRTFWGFTIVLIRFPEVLAPAHFPNLEKRGYRYELWRIHPNSMKKQVIDASAVAALEHPVNRTLELPNGTWTLSVAPSSGWGDPTGLALKYALGIVFSLMLYLLTRSLLSTRAKALQIAQELTRDLRENEEMLHVQTVELEEEVAERQMAQESLQEQATRLEEEVEMRQQTQEELEKLNENLEQRVQERTAELSEKNDELQNAYDDLKRIQGQLLQQDKMASVGQLAAGVAHEINNPMGFIISNLSSLGRYVEKLTGYLDADTKVLAGSDPSIIAMAAQERQKYKIDHICKDMPDLIAESSDGAQRVRQIVQDLKSFSHVDSGEFAAADINDGLDSTLSIAWNELKYKTTVTKEYGDLPHVWCNMGQLNQVFLNILVNAAHAIEVQGEITITTWEDNGNVLIAISDTGNGIKPENVKRIFDPFFTTKEVGKGTGLGLAIAYDIITNKHGGTINVASEVGVGTTFTIILPIEKKIQD